MPMALIWFLLAVVLAATEVMTGDFVLLMLGGGALLTSGVTWLADPPLWVQGSVFLVGSTLLLVGVRPMLRRRLAVSSGLLDPAQALEGEHALVLEQVDEHHGRVKLDGEVWSARSYSEADVYPPGERVTVVHIDGATAVVWKET